MRTRFALKLMFEWGGGCLWGDDIATFTAFGVGPIEDRLPLSVATRQRLVELSAWHDWALDWEYPPDPCPWSPDERERFERAAAEALAVVRSELGPEFEVCTCRCSPRRLTSACTRGGGSARDDV